MTAHDALIAASGDAAAIEKLLDGAVVDGGLWFADPSCASFAGGGKIVPDRFHEFARCLAGLHWHASQRRDALGDTVVLTYSPGFEIEARVAHELSGPHLEWIGYEARRDRDDGLPTVMASALELLRVAGSADGPVDAERARELELDVVPGVHGASAWFKVCIDTTGAIVSVDEREATSLKAASAFEAAIANWRFRPFTAGNKAVPVCSMERLAYPPSDTRKEETIPLPAPPSRSKKRPFVLAEGASLVEAQRLSGSKLIMPDAGVRLEMTRNGIRRVVGTFRLCLDDSGHVESVLPMRSTGFAEYDRELIAGMSSWVYSPFLVDGAPTPVCMAISFVYSQRERGMSPLR